MNACVSILLLLGLVGTVGSALAEESPRTLIAEKEDQAKTAPVIPWLGLDITKLSEPIRAHATDVPKGVGFQIIGVTQGGPASEAGVKPHDILWKFNDQLLINEAQFGTLLLMHQVGDSVPMSLVRSGQHLVLDLKIVAMPEARREAQVSPMDIPLIPAGVPGLPRQIVYPQQRTAETSTEDGSLVKLRHEEGAPYVLITDAEGEVIYDGPIHRNGELAIPKEWKCPVGALLRTLNHAEKPEWRSRRKPRPRVVVPPKRENN